MSAEEQKTTGDTRLAPLEREVRRCQTQDQIASERDMDEAIINAKCREIDALRAERDHNKAGWAECHAALQDAACDANRYRELLERLRQWDHLDTAGDGPFWKREIDKELSA